MSRKKIKTTRAAGVRHRKQRPRMTIKVVITRELLILMIALLLALAGLQPDLVRAVIIR